LASNGLPNQDRLLVYSEGSCEVIIVLGQPEEQANPPYLEGDGVTLACAAYAEIINPYNPVPS